MTKLQGIWSWLKRRNWTDFIAALALLIGAINLWHDLSPAPQRARFTVFLDNPAIWHNGDVTEIDLTGTIVNEGSSVGKIVRWDLFISMNVSYRTLLNKYEMPTDLLLSPTQRCDFAMQRTLIGENDSRLPDSAIRSCSAWFEYRDASGLQTAEAQVSFLE